MNYRKEIFGGILFCERKGYNTIANDLKRSAFVIKGFPKIIAKNILSYISLLLFAKEKKNRIGVYVYDNHFLVDGLKQKQDIFLVNPSLKMAFYCFENHIPFLMPGILDPICFRELYYKKKDTSIRSRIKGTKKQLKRLNCSYMVFPDDYEAFFRLHIFTGRMMGIKSLSIQHGIMVPGNDTIQGLYADHVLLWGEYFKKAYSLNVPDEKLVVMGYPYEIKNRENKTKRKTKVVLFLGENLSSYSDEPLKNVYKACLDLGYEIRYRFHPGEDKKQIKRKYEKMGRIIYSENSLEKDIHDSDVVIGLMSTVLFEALIYGLKAIQIENTLISIDFNELCGIPKIKNDYQAIKEALISVGNSKQWLDSEVVRLNPHYIDDVIDFIKEDAN